VVDRVVERVTAELTAQIRVVETLALSAALDTPDLPTFYREADRLKTAHPLWYTVELDDLSGRQVMNLLRPLGSELGPTADRDSFDRVVSERRPVVGGIGPVGPVSQRRLVTLRAPVMRGGMLQSVLTIAFAPDAISSILRDAGVPEGWVAAIVDGRGNVIARTLAEHATVGQPASADLRREIGRAESGVYPGRTLEGLDCEVNFRTLSAELGRWSIHLGVPLQSLNQPFYRAFVAVAGGILASLALAGILAALVAEDVRRRRALELGLADEALNESERRGALAVEAAELGTFQWDLREERVSSSERCRELLNVPPSAGTLLEWPSETFFAAVPAEDRETVVAAARRASRTGGEFTTEFRALCEDGSLRMAARAGSSGDARRHQRSDGSRRRYDGSEACGAGAPSAA
jgi:PAS domain-containing protein